MEFAKRLQSIRLECGMTQREVYTKLNISPNGYASYEQGRTEPNIETIVKLCSIFNVTSDYLLGLENEDGTKNYNNTYNNYGTHKGNVNF